MKKTELASRALRDGSAPAQSAGGNGLSGLNTAAGLSGVATLLFLATFIARFPGEMNPDSVDQFQQAVSGKYTDWHPPVMAKLWSAFRLVADGPWTMFAFHTALYWLGFGLIAVALMRAERRALAWCALLVGAFPPFLMIAINVHKDVGLAAVYLVAFALVFRSRVTGAPVPRVTQFVVALLIAYGVFVRSNAGFAALPLALYAWYPRLLERPALSIVLCVLAGLAAVPLTGWVNRNVLGAEPRGAIRSLQVFDIVGIAAYSGDPDLLSELGLDGNEIQNCYTPTFADTVYYDARCARIWRRLAVLPGAAIGDEAPQNHNPRVGSLWLNAIASHPTAYLRHRLGHFNSEIYFIVPSHHANVEVLKFLRRGEPIVPVTMTLPRRVMDVLRFGFWATPGFWLALSLAILFLGLRNPLFRGPGPAEGSLALSLSASVYTAGYFAVGVGTDPRYQFWSMLATALAAVLAAPAVAHLWRAGEAKRLVAPAAFMLAVVAAILASRMILQDPSRMTDASFRAVAGTEGSQR